MPDEDLVTLNDSRSHADDVASLSFDEFYKTEWRQVLALAYSLCGSTGMAADVTQDAFMAAFDRWDRIDNPPGWVRQVVANKAASTLRRKASETKALLRLRPAGDVPPLFDPAAEQLWAEVRSLPKRQAQVVALHYLDGHTLDSIAGLLGLSPNTVKTHLKRAKATLAQRNEDTP